MRSINLPLDAGNIFYDDCSVHHFVRYAPLDLTPQIDLGLENRSGPPYTRGSLFKLLSTVAAEDLPLEDAAALRDIDGDAWYLGQTLETLLNKLEDKDPTLPEQIGRNIYFMFRTQLQQMGITSATALVAALPSIWIFATRGDGGVYRVTQKGERHWLVEAEQPYNCLFEAGGLRGFIEALDGFDVEIDHATCMRRGDGFCTFAVKWQE